VVDYLESGEYHDHAHHMRGVSHGVFQRPIDVWQDQLQVRVNFLLLILHRGNPVIAQFVDTRKAKE
jgi:hypothetical protein